MKEEIVKELTDALQIIGSLAVTHDAQETVVAAKQKIRKAISMVKEEKSDG